MGCFPGPYLANNLTEVHIMQNTMVPNRSGGGTSSSTVMAAEVIAIAHVPYQRKSIFTSRAVFAHHLPKIGVLNGNSDSTSCVRGGREEYAILFIHLWFFFCSDTGLFSPCRRHLTLYL